MKKALLSFVLVVCFFACITAYNQNQNPTTDSLIVTALSMVSADSLRSSVQTLEDFGTRFMIAPNRKEVATWIMNRFISYGIPEVRLDSFLCYTNINAPPYCTYDTTTWQYNVEAKISGSVYPDREMIMMGHYDDFVMNADPLIASPGADDNASGVAALLECARVIMEMEYQPQQTMIFLATAAEELMSSGGSGSGHYAQEAVTNERDLVMIINNDMIAWNDGSWTLSLVNDVKSQRITDLAMHVIDTFTKLNRIFDWVGTYADLKHFLEEGFQGIFFIENLSNIWNPYYHTINDITDNIDTAYHAEITRANLGCLLLSDMLKNDAALLEIANVPEDNCTGLMSPLITIANYGSDTLTSLDIVCRVNEEAPLVFHWTGNLAFRDTRQVELQEITFVLLAENELEITLENINGRSDEIPLNNAQSIGFGMATATPSEVKLKIMLDNNPGEITWNVENTDGEIVFSGGPYSNPNALVDVTMIFDEPGCYIATVYDAGGNGLQPGFFILYYGSNIIISSITEFGSMAQVQFDVGGTLQLSESGHFQEINFYPNPVMDLGYIEFTLVKQTSVQASIYDLLGQEILELTHQDYGPGIHRLVYYTECLVPGLYIIAIRFDHAVIVQKMVRN